MEIVQLKEIVPDNLLSARYDGQDLDEFERLMQEWTDTEYLFDFFSGNSDLLFSGFYKGTKTIEEAVSLTISEADRFYDLMLDCNLGGSADLEVLFKPLHAGSTSIVREESKAYGPRRQSWLRLYAIRIAYNFYAISGGGIKLTETMQEGRNSDEHFAKLKLLANFLKANGLESPEDYTYLDIEFK